MSSRGRVGVHGLIAAALAGAVGAAASAGCSSTPDESRPAPAPDLSSTSAAITAPDPSAPSARSLVPTAAERARIESFRDSFYAQRDVRHSFHTTAGEAIDCIDFDAQSSVKALRALGHAPSFDHLPTPPAPPPTIPAANLARGGAFTGELDGDGRSRLCPAGTVPATRPAVAEIMARGGLDTYRNAKSRARPPQQSPFQYDCFLTTTGHPQWDHAAGLQHVQHSGALTYTSVHRPYVHDIQNEHSLSQLWVESGSCEFWGNENTDPNNCTTGAGGNAVQSVEVGWMVGNGAFDGNPHLFVFSTQDGYYKKSCFAGEGGTCCPSPGAGQGTDCWVAAPGAPYVVNQSLGSSFPQYTTPTEMAIQVWNGAPYGFPAWYVWINGQLIGWYPSTSFWGQMQSSASYLQVGGEVFDNWPGGAHTSTQMGSGFTASLGYMQAAYHRNVMYIDAAKAYHPANLGFLWVPPEDREANRPGLCGYEAGEFYDLSWSPTAGGTGWGSYFYFGGPYSPPK